MLQDLRYFARQTLHHPGFMITAVLSLALGIGATTTVFSVIYAGLMHPFPYRDAERIVRLIVRTRAVPFQGIQLNGPQIQQLRQLPIVETVLAMEFRPDSLTGNDVPENVSVVALISNGFSDLGVPPVLGRGLLPSDAMDGQDPQAVAVLSYKFWREHFLSSRDVLGKTMEIGHNQYTIVGVAAPRFTWYNGDAFVPLKLTQDPARMYIVNLRLRPGVTLSAADATLQPLLEEFAKVNLKQFPEGFQVQVEELNAFVARNLEGTLQLLFGAVVLLLAIGCGNVSILLLARGTARQHELAVRSAVGAQRSRILRQLLTESILLAVIGAALGILMAYVMLGGIRALLPTFAFLPEVVQLGDARFLHRGGAGLGIGVRFVAGMATVADANGPHDPVKHAAAGGNRERAANAQCFDRRANRAHAAFAGWSGVSNGRVCTAHAHPAWLQPSQRDVGGDSDPPRRLRDVCRTGGLF
jgi:predicted permease